MKVNLHTHSTISDGLLTPYELVKKLASDGVKIISLTDHDRIEGLIDAHKAALEYDVKLINGIEISVIPYHIEDLGLDLQHHSLHFLGLNFDLLLMMKIMDHRIQEKTKRIKILVHELINEGYEISSTCDYQRKTEIAQALVRKGYSISIHEAFENIINRFYPRYLDQFSIIEAIDVVHQAGGKILWAHPYDILFDLNKERIDQPMVEKIATRLKHLGIDGLEVYYQKFNQNEQEFLKKLQIKLGMIASCGTDYHAKDSQRITFMDIDTSLISEVLT